MDVIQTKRANVSERIRDFGLDVAIAFKQRHKIAEWCFPPINLTVLKSSRSGRRIRHDDPLNSIKADRFCTGQPIRRLIQWDIILILLEDCGGSWLPLGAHELHG